MNVLHQALLDGRLVFPVLLFEDLHDAQLLHRVVQEHCVHVLRLIGIVCQERTQTQRPCLLEEDLHQLDGALPAGQNTKIVCIFVGHVN